MRLLLLGSLLLMTGVGGCSVGCGAIALHAQSAAPEFDVASVKPAMPERSLRETLGNLRRSVPGQWQYFDLTLHNVILLAYPEFHLPGLVAGIPGWVKETRFDLQARMSPVATHADVQLMFRRLLGERFGLRTHIEQRMLDVYVLTLAKAGTPGPGLTRPPTACVVWRLTGGRIPDECDLYRRYGGQGALKMTGTMADLVTVLTINAGLPSRMTSLIDRPVVDRTGLEGFYQFVGPSPMGADGSFFTLMEEQLGLKLTRAREMVDVLVIDSVRMPDPD